MKKMMKGLVLSLLMLVSVSYTAPSAGTDVISSNAAEIVVKMEQQIKLQEQMKVYDKLYEYTINSIKKFEGLRLKKYYCMAVKPTIGYGHWIKPGEDIPNEISLEYADSLVKSDFEEALYYAEKFTHLTRYEDPNKILAVAHFIFNVGCGNFQRSTLRQHVLADKSIDNQITRFTKVKIPGQGYVHSPYLLKMRQFELALYNNKVESVNEQMIV